MVDLEFDDGLAVITIDRPHARNAISLETMDQLEKALDGADGARALVLTGAGDRAFVSGEYSLLLASDPKSALPAPTRWVSPDGDDRASGSAARPFATIAQAAPPSTAWRRSPSPASGRGSSTASRSARTALHKSLTDTWPFQIPQRPQSLPPILRQDAGAHSSRCILTPVGSLTTASVLTRCGVGDGWEGGGRTAWVGAP